MPIAYLERMPTVAEICEQLESETPLSWAEPWDNVGLLCGDPQMQVTGIMLTVDFHAEVAAEAIRAGCNMIAAYHPPLFKAVARLGPSNLIWPALAHGLAVWSPHTAFDVGTLGTNDWVAKRLQLSACRPLRPAAQDSLRGTGRIGQFSGDGQVLVAALKGALCTQHLLVSGVLPLKPFCLAIAAGSGASMAEDAASQGADVFLTGEASHHDALRVGRLGMCLVTTFHSVIERPAVREWSARLHDGLGIGVHCSESDRDPYRVV